MSSRSGLGLRARVFRCPTLDVPMNIAMMPSFEGWGER
jgi:hypothetical protein